MNLPSAGVCRSFRLDAVLILIIGLTAGVSLAAAVYLPAKWMFFIIFLMVVVGVFSMVQQREKLLLYLSVVLTSVFLGFHPIYIESAVFPWPISGFRITIFEVAFFFLFVSWMFRLVMNPALKVRFYPWITIPFLLIWGLSLAGLARVTMPGAIKFSNLWLLLESWLIFLYFANNIRDRQMVYNIVAVLLITGGLQSLLGLAQYLAGGTLGLQVFGETKSYNVMAAGAEFISRVSGTFGHPNNLAGYLVMLVLINLALFGAPISPRVKLLLCPAFLLISTTLILTFSRGGWLALGFGGMVTLYLCFLRWSRHRVISFIVALALLVTFFIASVGLISPLRQRLFQEDYGAAQSRVPLSLVAMNIIYHHPWLGVGLGNYTFAAPDYDISREGISYEFHQPVHNEFLLIAAEQGLPALALFLVILIYIFSQLLRLSRSRDDPILPYVAIGLVGTYFAWCAFRQTDYNYVLLGDPFWLLAGLSLALVQVNHKEAGIPPHSGQAAHNSQ
ncbi:MAG: O-antigen ligase family protein [Deltaproteobacteria bacterium]|nr:O-antigen ligase family protein [Deltaproteobacteria bacterium]MBI4796851.1 O-antigen ligase family protein [Deltaproteobacteria bacterium]